MAPEQLRGGARDVAPAADVYAIGAIVFRMFTGRASHDSRSIEELLLRKITQPAPSAAELAPGLPSTLVHLAARCLEADPARRTITAAEVTKELGEMARMQRGSSLPPLAAAHATHPGSAQRGGAARSLAARARHAGRAHVDGLGRDGPRDLEPHAPRSAPDDAPRDPRTSRDSRGLGGAQLERARALPRGAAGALTARDSQRRRRWARLGRLARMRDTTASSIHAQA